MNVKQTIQIVVGLGVLLPAIGCGTITSGRRSDVTIMSNPAGAHVVVKDRKGKEVASANTPAVVNLKRGYYLMPAQYTASVEAPGFEPKDVEIGYKINPWMWGNIVLGGVIGLAVDDTTGAMWKPKQDTIALNLAPNPAANQAANSSPAQMASNPSGPTAKYGAGAMANHPAEQVQYQEPLPQH